MKRHLSGVIAVAAGVGLLAAVAAIAQPLAAQEEQFEAGNIVASDHGGITPLKLPRHRKAPIFGHIHARFSTKDGSHMPAAREMTFDFDRTLQVEARGLPVCSEGQLKAQSTAAARRVCGDALVGSGSGEVEVAFPEQAPFSATGTLLAFNGGVHGGKTLLFVHSYINVPSPTAVVARIEIEPIDRGHYGLHTVTEIPRIAGGAGSVTRVDLNLGRKFTYKGKPMSYLTASCPTGHYYIKGNLGFDDGTNVHVTHFFPCIPTR